MSKRAKLFIVSAPSGSGKTTLCTRLLGARMGLTDSISMTTRPRRSGETDGKDYFFVSEKEFKARIRQQRFLEWTRTYGWYYGTPAKFVTDILARGDDVLLSIDVKGAMNVKRLLPGTILIFIVPPSIGALKERLTKRNSDGPGEIAKRLTRARRELTYAGKYDYCVVNDRIEKALGALKAIITAERCRVPKR
ncbi:MAG: guanylate kinase [Candidatus Omnitrophota bacterium]